MKVFYVWQKVLFCTLISLLIFMCWSADTLAAGTGGGSNIFITTYYWIPRTSGDITVSGRTQDHSLDTRESLETSNFGGLLAGEKWYGRWGLAFDLLVMALKDKSRAGSTELNAILDTSMTEFSFLWRLADRTTGGALMHDPSTTGWAVDLEGGVRNTRVDLELDINPGADLASSAYWTEPFAGGRFLFRPSRNWMMGVRMDAGGFSIGSASDLTWNLAGGADYRVGEEKWIQVGYRMMGIQFEDSSGQAGVDVLVMGPMVAFRLDF